MSVTIRVAHRLSRSDLISILCWPQRGAELDDTLPTWSIAQIRCDVRDTLAKAGLETCWYWTDDVDGGDVEERLRSWAEECVRRAWPGAR